jgi:uncharacterized protein (TIGR02271 family)
MTMQKNTTVVGVFHDPAQAQQAVRDLKAAGFRDDQIGVVSHDKGTKQTDTKGAHVAEGAVAGVATGAGIGALWALGISVGLLPGIGPAIAGGLLASVLASAAAGGAVAGVAGALVGLGIPEEDATYYEGEFKAGRTIVTVNATGRSDEAWSILHAHGAYNRQTMNATDATPAVATRATESVSTAEGKTIPVREEKLQARKTPVKKGEVKVRKEVVTENETIQVPVTREEVVIERRPASGRASAADIKAGEEIRIPITEEQVRVDKDTVVKGEVTVGKRKVTGTETVSGRVRKEKVKVEKEGAVDVLSPAASKKAHK